MHKYGEYYWSLWNTVYIFEPKNCNSYRLQKGEEPQQIIPLKPEADAGLKQINIIVKHSLFILTF